jgi:hypothetical protein
MSIKQAAAEVVRVTAGAVKAGISEEEFVAAEVEKTRMHDAEVEAKRNELDRLHSMTREEKALAVAVAAALKVGIDVSAFVAAEIKLHE